MQVYQSFNTDEGSYYALVAVNWGSNDASIEIDLQKTGVTASAQSHCQFFDLWTGRHLGSASGSFSVEKIMSHGHVAMKVQCSPSAEEETEFLI